MRVIHIVCCNDAVMAGVIGSEEYAEAFKDKLSRQDYQKRKFDERSYEEFRKIAYWHLHTVPLYEEEE